MVREFGECYHLTVGGLIAVDPAIYRAAPARYRGARQATPGTV